MRKDIEELNQIPPDYQIDGDSEITPPPDEFNRDTPTHGPAKKKASSMRKVMLYLASAGIVVVGCPPASGTPPLLLPQP